MKYVMLLCLLFAVTANAEQILYDISAPVANADGDSLRILTSITDTNDSLLTYFSYYRADTIIYHGVMTLYDQGGDSTGIALSVIQSAPSFDWKHEAIRQGVQWKDLLELMKYIRFLY